METIAFPDSDSDEEKTTATMPTPWSEAERSDSSPLRSRTLSKPYNDWSPLRRAAAKVVHSLHFELVVGVVTLINLCVVVLETNKRADCRSAGHSEDDCDLGVGYRMINIGFLLIYSVEISARVYVDRMTFLQNWWNFLDVVIVSLSALAEILNGVFPSMAFLRMFRTVRLFRSVRFVTIQRELYLLVHGFLSTMRALFWAAILMIGLLTMWSILAVEVLHPINRDVALYTDDYKECSRCSQSFASVWDANLTFFNTIVLGDGWADFILPVIYRESWTILIFMGVTFSVGLGLVNLILAVIVDRAREAHEEDIDHQNQAKHAKMEHAKKSISKLFATMDADGSGTLSLSELLAGYEESDALRSLLNVLDIEKDDIECVFHIMDNDGSGDVSYKEFVDNLYRMKSHNSRTLLVFIKFYVLELRRNVQEELRLVKGDILRSLSLHTRMLSEMSPSATADSSRSKKALVHRKSAPTMKDRAEETVPHEDLGGFTLPHSNIVATAALTSQASQEQEPHSEKVSSPEDLLRKLATADCTHGGEAVRGCPSEKNGAEAATSEVLPFPDTANQLMSHRSVDAPLELQLNAIDGTLVSRASEAPSLQAEQSLPGVIDRMHQPRSPPPELKLNTNKEKPLPPGDGRIRQLPTSGASSQKLPPSDWAVEDVH